MKTFIFSALALGMMASCANTDVEGVVENGEPVAITLSAEVEATTVLTRAAIEQDAKFKATVLGWEDNNITDFEVNPAWTAVSSDINVSKNVTSNITLTDAVDVSKAEYYKADGTKTYMKAFYVDGESPKAQSSNAWIYDLTKKDGSLDILIADAINGDKNTSAGSFEFKHPLTKLIFQVKAGDGLADNVTLTSIKVKGMSVPEKINLGTSKVEFGENPTDLSIGVTAGTTIPSSTTDAAIVGAPIMVKPISASFTIDVVTSAKTYENVNVTLKTVAGHEDGAGVAYVITLTIKDQISTSASVADWAAGEGEGTVG